MPSERVLADAGPLIALFDADEARHEDCVNAARALRGPLYTVWPAVTEAIHLLGFSRRAQDALLEWVESGGLKPLPLDGSDMPRARALMEKYADARLDFADAALIRVAEREGIRTVFTLDKGFKVVRPAHARAFTLLP